VFKLTNGVMAVISYKQYCY